MKKGIASIIRRIDEECHVTGGCGKDGYFVNLKGIPAPPRGLIIDMDCKKLRISDKSTAADSPVSEKAHRSHRQGHHCRTYPSATASKAISVGRESTCRPPSSAHIRQRLCRAIYPQTQGRTTLAGNGSMHRVSAPISAAIQSRRQRRMSDRTSWESLSKPVRTR